MYTVGLGDSPMIIARQLSGNPRRYHELLRANPYKPIVYVAGQPTFASLGVGEQLFVPASFVGDALVRAFGVGSQEDAFARLAHTFGTSDPDDAFARLAHTFGTSAPSGGDLGLSGLGLSGVLAFGLGNVGLSSVFDDIGDAVGGAVSAIGSAAGATVDAVASVAQNAADAAQKAVWGAANFAAAAGADVGNFMAEQGDAIAKDPLGALAKIATSGPLGLIGVDPEDVLKKLGIPTPGQMLRQLGLPDPLEMLQKAGIPTDPSEITRGITNPAQLLSKIPGVGELTKYIPSLPDPTKMASDVIQAVASGDLDKVKNSVVDVGHQFTDIISMVPGVGNVIGGPLEAALALIDSGSPLRAALELLLGQIPAIPPDIRSIFLRPILDGVADIVEKGTSVTDAFLSRFKEGVMAEASKKGIPATLRDVIGDAMDAVVNVIVRHRPIQQAIGGMAKQAIDTAKGDIAKVSSLQKAYGDVKSAADNSNESYALTQGIIQLNKKDPGKRDPTAQKQIQDMNVSRAARKLAIQAHKQALDSNLGVRSAQAVAKRLPLPPSAVLTWGGKPAAKQLPLSPSAVLTWGGKPAAKQLPLPPSAIPPTIKTLAKPRPIPTSAITPAIALPLPPMQAAALPPPPMARPTTAARIYEPYPSSGTR